VLQAAGTIAQVYEPAVPAEHAILTAAAAENASLLVLRLGNTKSARSRAAAIARLVACSVLLIPAPAATRTVEGAVHVIAPNAGADGRGVTVSM
jgi:hypothetical protein